MGLFLYDKDLRHERVKYHKLQKTDNFFGTDEITRSLKDFTLILMCTSISFNLVRLNTKQTYYS